MPSLLRPNPVMPTLDDLFSPSKLVYNHLPCFVLTKESFNLFKFILYS